MNLAYVEHPHHQITNSTTFLLDKLAQFGFSITRIKRDDFSLELARYFDYIVLFQSDSQIKIAAESKIKTLVVPMLDEALSRSSNFYISNENIQYLSFSKVLHDFLVLSGHTSRYVQFWPEKVSNTYSHNSYVFFWERTPEHVNENDVIRWFEKSDMPILIRTSLDPGQVKIENKYINSKKVSRINFEWNDKYKYLDALSKASIVIAPRRWEGIGLSYLEALARGIPVVGLDSPVLSEYIKNDYNGKLIRDKFNSLNDFNLINMHNNILISYDGNRMKFENGINEVLNDFVQHKAKLKRNLLPRNLTLRHYIFLTQNR